MKNRVSASAAIAAPADVVYRILADYRAAHPRILPPEYFRSLRVERGGRGAGTELVVEMRVLGVTRAMRLVVAEPVPGRVLVERDREGGTTTIFTVRQRASGAEVTIETRWLDRGGLLGFVERWLTRRMLARIYARELELLAEHAGAQASARDMERNDRWQKNIA